MILNRSEIRKNFAKQIRMYTQTGDFHHLNGIIKQIFSSFVYLYRVAI